MRLYLECAMGASGDMLMSALYELLPDKDIFRAKMERLGLPDVKFEYAAATKCGITGTRIAVKVGGAEEKSEDVPPRAKKGAQAQPGKGGAKNHAHAAGEATHTHGKDAHTNDGHTHTHDGVTHTHADGDGDHVHSHSGGRRYGFQEIIALIKKMDLPDNVLADALDVYRLLGEAEAAVHGVAFDSIHLHEVGSLDAVADIVGCCMLVNMLSVTDITASAIHVGSGSVRCEHGVLPVPAPAAAEILKGVPIYGGSIKGELCTPTGAALLKHFVRQFGDMQPMTVLDVGYGMGTKDFEAANCLRAFLCEDEVHDGRRRDNVCEISCNLDDMTPEAVGAVFGVLFDNGALDVYTTPIMMKKNRPAVMLTCLCEQDKSDALARAMLVNTTTLGVRVVSCRRDVLTRVVETVSTEFGEIRIKHAQGFGALKLKPEYDDVLDASKRHGVPFMTVHAAAIEATKS